MNAFVAQSWFFGCMILVGVVACRHFGWEGLAIPAALWLIAPQITVR